MTKRPLTLRSVLPLVAALILLAGGLALRFWQEQRGQPPLRAPVLRAELAALPPIDAAEFNRWRAQHAALAARQWTEPARADLETKLGIRWRWRPLPASAGTHAYALQAVVPEAVAWSSVVTTLQMIESAAGAAVDALEIVTAGSRTVRHFSRIEIRVRFQWAESGTAPTVPPAAVGRDRGVRGPGLPGGGAKGRARPAPLRRTSASAQPPASERSPLRVRSDPSRRPRSRPLQSQPPPSK